MSKAITKRILVITILIVSTRLNAQQWLGRTTGNYTGTYGLYNNASSIADSKYKYYFNFWGRGVNFYNNYLQYNAPIKLNQWANGTYNPSFQRLDGKADFQKDWLLEDLNGKTKQFSFNQDIWGPAFMFPISKKVNMSINTRQRNSLQMFGIGEPIAQMAHNGLDSSGGIYGKNGGLNRNEFYSNGKFGANVQSNQELSFSFAGILAQNEHHMLTGGATVKFIRGLGAAYVKGSGFDLAATGNNSAQLANADIQYGYTDDKSVVAPFNKPYGLFTLDSRGRGAGLDLGITYTYTSQKGKYSSNKYCNSNDNKSDYDIKLAAAFNDLGSVRFNQNSYKYSYTNSSTANLNVPSSVLNGFNQTKQNAFDTIGKQVFGQLGASKSSGFNSSLPTAFNFQADFRFSKHFFTAVYLNQSLKSINSTGMRSTSMLSIIPRVESRGVEFSMPLTLGENYQNFTMGAYLRVGPVFFGSDNLGGLLNVASNNQFKGADIYGGVSFGIGHCHRWWYENKVEPNRIDTVTQKDTVVKKDTLKTVKKDTLKIIKHDTIRMKVHDTIIINKKGETINKTIHDTLYIEKTIKSKADIDRENEIKNKEAIIIIRQRELDQREKDIREKEKGVYNENDALRKCKDQTTVILTENTTLKNKVSNQTDEIIRLQKIIDDCSKNKSLNDAEIIRVNKDKAKAENDAKVAARKADSLQLVLTKINVDLTNCKKNSSSQNEAEVTRAKTKAENDAKVATAKADSIQKRYNMLLIEFANCKKTNSSDNSAEITKAKNDAKAAIKKADSLQAIYNVIYLELKDCKTNNSSTNQAEVTRAKTKAENDAKAAAKKADSLQVIYNIILTQLTDCKKNSSDNEATISKLKKSEDEKAIYKAELDMANKNNSVLTAKVNKRDVTIDSLLLALAGCDKTNSSDNYAVLLKKCNDAKADMNNEISDLKNRIILANKALDSTTVVAANLKKDKSVLEAQISELNAKIKSSNCDELTKAIEEKNKNISDLTTQNTGLQNKVNTLTAQLNNLQAEYMLIMTQNQKCSKKLDSCMRGLLDHKDIDQTPPGDKGIDNGTGGGGPMEGSTDNKAEYSFNKTTYNFGTVNQGEQLETTFALTNTGKVPVTIISYSSDNGYSTLNYSKDPIPPGESTNIFADVNTITLSGTQNITFNIVTSAGTQILTLKTFVMEKAKVDVSSGNGNGNGSSSGSSNSGTSGLGWQILKAVINAAATSGSTTPSSSGSGSSGSRSSGSSGSSGSTNTRSNGGSSSTTTTTTTTKTNTETGSGSSGSTSTTRSGTSNTNTNTAPSTRRR